MARLTAEGRKAANEISNKREIKSNVVDYGAKYTVTNQSGQVLGTVSYDAKEAIEKNKLDSYKPKNDEEKRVIDSLMQEAYKNSPYGKLEEGLKATKEIESTGKGNAYLKDSGVMGYQVKKSGNKYVVAPRTVSGFEGAFDYMKSNTLESFDKKEDAEEYVTKLEKANDFKIGSRYESTAKENVNDVRPNLAGFYDDSGFEDIKYDYINKNKTAISRQQLLDVQSGSMALGLDESFLKEMTDDEISVFNYLYKNMGKEKAYEYLKNIQGTLTGRQRNALEKQFRDEAKENPISSSLFTILTSPAKGLSYMGQVADYLDDGKIDQNAGYNKFSYTSSAIRDEVSKKVEKNWGKAGSWGYQLGMSMGDMLMNSAMGAGNEAFTLALMGAGAAADGVISAKDRGLSDNQAFALGTINGAVEVVTEKIGYDKLFKTDILEKGIKKYIFGNIASNAAEEGTAALANTITDIFISKDKSEWSQDVAAYMKEGDSKAKAIGKAVGKQALNIGLDALGGALMGGTISGVNAGTTYVAANNSYTTNRTDIRNIINTGLGLDKNSDAYKNAVKMQEKQDLYETGYAKKGVSDYEVVTQEWKNHEETTKAQGKNVSEVKEEVIKTGLESPKESEAYKNAKILSKKKNVSDYDLGKQYLLNVEQVDEETPEIKTKFAPGGATENIINLEKMLANEGVAEKNIEKIVSDAVTLESSLAKTPTTNMTAEMVERASGTITNQAKNNLAMNGAKNADYWGIYGTNLEVLSKSDKTIDEGFIDTYADAYAEGLKEGNSISYHSLAENTDNVAKTLKNYVLTGAVPETMRGTNIVEKAGGNLKGIIQSAVGSVSTAHKIVYGEGTNIARQAEAIKSGDFSSVISGESNNYKTTPSFNNAINTDEIRMVMNSTFKEGAMENIAEIMSATTGGVDMGVFAYKLAEYYQKNGNITPFRKYFADGGIAVTKTFENMARASQTVTAKEKTAPPETSILDIEEVENETTTEETTKEAENETGEVEKSAEGKKEKAKTESEKDKEIKESVPEKEEEKAKDNSGKALKRLGQKGKAAYRKVLEIEQSMHSEMSEYEVLREFEKSYRAGREGVKNTDGSRLTEQSRKVAEKAGKDDRKNKLTAKANVSKKSEEKVWQTKKTTEKAVEKESVSETKEPKSEKSSDSRDNIEVQGKGTVKWSSLHPRQQKAIVFMEGFAKAANMKLVFVANSPNFDGAYDISGDTMYLDIYAGVDPTNKLSDIIIPTASHELTHWMHFQAPVLWNKLSGAVFSALEEVDGINRTDRITNEIERLKGNGLVHNELVAEDEIVARACEDMLAQSEMGKKVFETLSETEQKTITSKIKDILTNLKNWISDFLSSYKPSNRIEAEKIRQAQDKVDEILKLWNEGIEKSVEVSRADTKAEAFVGNDVYEQYGVQFEGENGMLLSEKVSPDKSVKTKVVDLSMENELTDKIKGLKGAEKYKVIRDYILDVLDDTIVFSDGIEAKVDKSDASHLAAKAGHKKTSYISKIREIIDSAELYAVADNVEHNKFDGFRYYQTTVRLGEDEYPIYLNVGHAKNGDGYHLYDITKNVGEAEKQISVFERVKDLRSKNDFPTTKKIPQSEKNVKENFLTSEKNIVTKTPEQIYRMQNRDIIQFIRDEYDKSEKFMPRIEDVKKSANKLGKGYTGEKNLAYEFGKLYKEVKAAIAYGERTDATEQEIKRKWDEVQNKIDDIAMDIVMNDEVKNDENWQMIKDFRRYLHGRTIKVPAEWHADFDAQGGIDGFRKHNRGRFFVSYTKGESIETLYPEMRGMFGNLLPDISNPADQLIAISDFLDEMAVTFENPYDSDIEAAAESMSLEIMADMLVNIREVGDDVRSKRIEKLHRVLQEERLKRYHALNRVKERQERKIKEATEKRKASAEKKADMAARQRLLAVAKKLESLAKKSDAEKQAEIQKLIGHLDLAAVSITDKKLEKLKDIKNFYDGMKNDPDFIEDKRIEKTLERLEKKQISDLDLYDVQELTDVLLAIEHKIRTDAYAIETEDKRKISVQAKETMRNIENSSGSKASGIGKFADNLIVGVLTPTREARRITGYVDNDPLYLGMKNMQSGQVDMFDYAMKAEKMFEKYTNDKKFMESITGAKAKTYTYNITEKDAKGREIGKRKIELTAGMRISLLLHNLNSSNQGHMKIGGVTIPDAKLYKAGKMQEAYARGQKIYLHPSDIKMITKDITEKEREYARVVWRYYNEFAKSKINRVSLKLKGYEIARVKNYFPIDTNKDFSKQDFELMNIDGTIEGMGFLKERIEAKNPIMLIDVASVLEKSIRMNSKYVGLAIPVRNMSLLLGKSFSEYGEATSTEKQVYGLNYTMEKGYYGSVMDTIGTKWGTNGKDYINKIMQDMQGKTNEQGPVAKVVEKIGSRYVRGILSWNPKVAFNQVASIPSAIPEVGFKALARSMFDWGKVDTDLIAEYTPLQYMRSKGAYDTTIADMAKAKKGVLAAVDNVVDKVDMMTWTDTLMTRKLWKAATYNIKHTRSDLKEGTREFYEAVAEVYVDIMQNTQPNVSMMERPQYLRSDPVTKMLMAFKGEPFKNLNLLYESAGNYKAKDRQLKQLKNNKTVTKQEITEAENRLKQAQSEFATTAVSQVIASLVYGIEASIFQLLYGKIKDYWDEEEEKVTFESWLVGVLKDSAINTVTQLPFANYVVDIVGSLNGGRYYSPYTPPALDSVDTATKSIPALVSAAQDIISGKINLQQFGFKAYDAIEDISTFLGIPLANVRKNIKTIIKGVIKASISNEYLEEYAVLKAESAIAEKKENNKGEIVTKGSSEAFDILYRAMENGDPKAYNTIVKDLQDRGVSYTDIESAMQNRAKKDENFNLDTSLNMYAGVEERGETEKYEKYIDSAEELGIDEELLKKVVDAANSKKKYKERKTDAEKIINNASLDFESEEFLKNIIADSYSVNDLSKEQYIEYSETRATYLQKVDNEIDSEGMSEREFRKVYNKASDLAEEYAFSQASDGEYSMRAKWMYYAVDAEEEVGMTTGEFLKVYEEYGSTIYSTPSLITHEVGYDVSDYLEFHKLTKDIKGEKDEKGKDIKGKTKQDKIIKVLRDMDVSNEMKAYLFSTEYKSTDNNPWRSSLRVNYKAYIENKKKE